MPTQPMVCLAVSVRATNGRTGAAGQRRAVIALTLLPMQKVAARIRPLERPIHTRGDFFVVAGGHEDVCPRQTKDQPDSCE